MNGKLQVMLAVDDDKRLLVGDAALIVVLSALDNGVNEQRVLVYPRALRLAALAAAHDLVADLEQKIALEAFHSMLESGDTTYLN